MCLGIPGRIIATYMDHGMLMGKVDFGGISKEVCLEHTPQAVVGQYVIVHVGFSLQVIDEDEAQQVFSFLQKIDDLDAISIDSRDAS